MPAKTKKKLPASGSDTDALAILLKTRKAWRLMFLAEAGAIYDHQACAELEITRDECCQLRAIMLENGRAEFK